MIWLFIICRLLLHRLVLDSSNTIRSMGYAATLSADYVKGGAHVILRKNFSMCRRSPFTTGRPIFACSRLHVPYYSPSREARLHAACTWQNLQSTDYNNSCVYTRPRSSHIIPLVYIIISCSIAHRAPPHSQSAQVRYVIWWSRGCPNSIYQTVENSACSALQVSENPYQSSRQQHFVVYNEFGILIVEKPK